MRLFGCWKVRQKFESYLQDLSGLLVSSKLWKNFYKIEEFVPEYVTLFEYWQGNQEKQACDNVKIGYPRLDFDAFPGRRSMARKEKTPTMDSSAATTMHCIRYGETSNAELRSLTCADYFSYKLAWRTLLKMMYSKLKIIVSLAST